MTAMTLKDLPNGWFSPGDVDFYRYIYRELVPAMGRTCEVGVHRGRSICCVSDIIRDRYISVVAVDNWEPWELSNDDDYAVFQAALIDFQIVKNARVYDMPSLMAAELQSREFDFVFLDDDHSYEHVKAELQVWESKIKAGGYIGGHDFNLFEGVNRAVLERYPSNRIIMQMDSEIWLVQL